jgi:FSR family fosmidomycin resistance protein-like MFS transporter
VSSAAQKSAQNIVMPILVAVSLCHLLNDIVQSLIPAIYPFLKTEYHLNYAQIGWITFTFQVVASLLQPGIGMFTDKRPLPFSLPLGMCCTLLGLLLLAYSHTFGMILFAAALVGVGSAVFHPEASRVARMASGGQHGFAQSFFQVGGNAGHAIGPLLAAVIVFKHGQESIALFSVVAILGIMLLTRVGFWYRAHHVSHQKAAVRSHSLPPHIVKRSLAILILLTFTKNFYLVSITSYFSFYLIQRFHIADAHAPLYLFAFLGAVAAGTLIGGLVTDRYGRKFVIWTSIVGALPFTLALPYANLQMTAVLSVLIGLIISSAFSAILVYAQELVPGRVGLISGLFFGCAFGMAGIGAAVLGYLADHTSIEFVYHVCSYLPLLGLLTALLPDLDRMRVEEPAWVPETEAQSAA